MINELIMMAEMTHGYTAASADKVLEALKEYNSRVYDNVKWALDWGMMNWAEAAEYVRKEVM